MKIGIDASRANAKHKTGIEWYSYFLIEEFKKIVALREPFDKLRTSSQDDNLEVTLYSGEALEGNLAQLPEGWSSKILKWPLRYIWTHIRLSWEVLVHPPDILFIPAHTVPIFTRKKTKVYTTVHDVGFIEHPEFYNPLTVPYHILSVWIAKWKAEKIITVSEFSKSRLAEKFRIPESKIVAIPLGFDSRQYNNLYSPQVIQQTLDMFYISKPYLLYVGRIEKKKNSERLIEAFAKVRATHSDLTLVFPGTIGHGYKELRTKIDQLGIREYVRELGYVPSCEIAALYKGAQAFVFPSLYEGFGIPVLEAMGSGTPVVTSNSTSLPEVGGDAAYYCDPYDVDDIAQKVNEVLEDKELRNALIQKGLDRVKGFSWEETAKKTLKILIS